MTETSPHPRKPSLLCFFTVGCLVAFLGSGSNHRVPSSASASPSSLLPASSVRSSSFAPSSLERRQRRGRAQAATRTMCTTTRRWTTHVLQRLLLDARAEELDLAHLKRDDGVCCVKVRPLKDWASSQASIWIWGGRTVARDRTAGCTPREHAPPGKAPARSDSRRRPRRCPRARARRRRRSGGRGGGGGGGGAACSRGGVAPPRPRRRRCRCGRARH